MGEKFGIEPGETMRDEFRQDGNASTAGRVAAIAFFVLFVLIQTVVPLVKLWSPRPARFGWQMFSGRQPRVRFALVLHDGTRQPANLARYVAQSRGEVDLVTALPPHLCRVVPDLASVEITTTQSKEPRVYECP